MINLFQYHTNPETLSHYNEIGKNLWHGGKTLIYKDDKGRAHRDDDLPAMIEINGDKSWWRHGNLHRAGGKPAIVKVDGTVEYYLKGNRVKPPVIKVKTV